MAKKDLASVTTDLSALASQMPTQRPAAAPPPPAAEPPALKVVAPPPKPKPQHEPDEITQFSLSLRKGLRKQLARLADEADMTMRAFVLNALKAKGLDVRADDLVDLRKDRR
jgi:hypothetical protein